MADAALLEEYVVSKNLCIDCNACYTTYPEVFKQVPWEGETKAEAHSKVQTGKYNPWDVIGVCPTDAISKIGEMPPKPEIQDSAALPPLENLGPWEERWERVKDKQDSRWEVMKRYGMAATVTEKKDRYVIKFEFPATTPLHIRKFQMGLPDIMPDYEWAADLDPTKTELTISGVMTDPHIKNLCGKINSFPDRFRRTLRLNSPVEFVRKSYRNKILSMELKKINLESDATSSTVH